MMEGSERVERDWGDLEALPPQKSVFPRWLWFCGGGCLVMLVLALAAGWWTFDWVRKGMDVDAQWERLAEILPYDERTQEHELQFGGKVPFVDCEVFMFVPVGFQEAVLSEGGDSAEQTEDAQNEVDEAPGERPGRAPEEALFVALMHFETDQDDQERVDELGGGEDAERFELEVQGLELDAYRTEGSGPAFPGMPQGSQSSVMLLLPTDEDGRETILVFVRQGSSEPVGAEEIVEFLAPFHVGPVR